jgi:hypothetical protein
MRDSRSEAHPRPSSSEARAWPSSLERAGGILAGLLAALFALAAGAAPAAFTLRLLGDGYLQIFQTLAR